MIGFLRGKVLFFEGDAVVVDAGGVGFLIHVTPSMLASTPGEEVKLYISPQFGEDGMHLFGFKTREEKQVFELLRRTSGVGARKALAVLSILEPSEVVDAVISDSWQVLARAPGIGPKTAKRIVLDLKDKIRDLAVTPKSKGENIIQLEAALDALGYKSSEVAKAVEKLQQEAEGLELSELVRRAIAFLSRG